MTGFVVRFFNRARVARWLNMTWIVGAVGAVLVALYVVVAGQLLLLLPSHRDDIVAWLSGQIGMHVEIDGIAARMRLLRPVVHLRGVRLYMAAGGADAGERVPVLAVPVVDLELAPLATALARRPILDLLRVEGIDLALEEGEDGRFRLKGMPLNVNDSLAAERLQQILRGIYQQQDIVVERARLSIDSAQVPVTAFESIRLHMHNDGDRHEVTGAATAVGPGRLPVSFVMHFGGTPVTRADFAADLWLHLQPSSAEGWLPRRDVGNLWVDSLSGGGEAWLRFEHAQVVGITGRVQVNGLAFSLADGSKIEGVLDLNSRFRWLPHKDGWTLALGGLQFRRQGLNWPETDGAIDVAHDAAGNLRIRAALSRGSLQMLSRFADVLPPARAELRAVLERTAPQGQIANLRLGWDAAAEPAKRWHLATDFTQLALRADGALPGISGMSGHLELLPQAGMVAMRAQAATVALPTMFAAPLTLDEAALRAVWRHDAGGWQVRTDRFTLRNADARASGLATLEVPADSASPRLQLLGLVEDGNAQATLRYLPLATSEGLRNWLSQAGIDGHLRRGSFLFDGPLRKEPALLAQRTFQMRFEADAIKLNFLPGWPAYSGEDADVLVSAGRVDGRGRQGRLLDSVLNDIHLTITPPAESVVPGEGSATPVATPSQLLAQAHVDGGLADVFTIFGATPLRTVVPAELLRWRGDGRLSADVEVAMALGAATSPRVTVGGAISGATLTAAAHALEVSDVSGKVQFDTIDGFSGQDLRGRVLGSALVGSARTVLQDGRQQTLIDLRGRLNMQPVNAWLQVPVLDVLKGESDAALVLRFDTARGGSAQLEVRSDLRGIASTAPAPLGKSAKSAVDTRLSYGLGTDTPRLTLLSGKMLAADVTLKNGTPLFGAIALGSTRLPVRTGNGLVIEGSAPAISIVDWLAFTGRMTGDTSKPPAQDFSLAGALAGIAGLGERLQRINVTADRMDTGVLPLEAATLRMGRDAAGWSVSIDSRSLRGQLLLPDGYRARGEQPDDRPLVVQINTLTLPTATAARLGSAGELKPATIPRMALALNNIRIGNDDYGSWSLETIPDQQGVRLRDVHGAYRALDIQGQGTWTAAPGGATRTQFVGTASADDLARVSEAFGFAPNISSAQAKMTFDLAWAGRPVDFDLLKATGTAALDFRDGRFITDSAKSQALRALGVFNVGTWQRRLKFDFSDLYKKGVAFDSLSADLAIDAGRLTTENLRVKGPSAMFELSGSTDLASHLLDTRLQVTLPVNSNLYVGCLAGLVACAGIVAVERLWGDRLEKMTMLAYEVSGVWEDPQVKQVEGGNAAAAAEAKGKQ